MKILITSDNHLGYKENDPVRQDDSFTTFDEICKTAIFHKVDCILQVGDLFHDNRPSRYCINRTINILRKHIVDKNITQSTYKVKIPVICIHGNHDDPSGINKISTLDILQSAGLIQYIGKNDVEYIQMKNVRVYGVGYIKDKNINGAFRRLIFKDLSPEYFNILLVHQNRIPRNKDYLCPSVLPDLFNLVVYGHEHDPAIIRNETTVLQCGSTVRTSLCEGESTDKYCYIIEDYVLTRVKLNSVRLFKIEDTSLTEEKDIIEKIDEIIIGIDNNIKRCKKNEKLSSNIKNEYIDVRNIESSFSYPPLLPLIRLRILTTNVLNLNKNRISHIFKDRVANPSDIIKLVPHKKIKNTVKSTVYQSQNITDIIKSHLKCTPLECIPEYKFLEYFNRESEFLEMVDENVLEISRKMKYDNCLIDDIEGEIKKIKVDMCRKNCIKDDEIVERESDTDERDDNEYIDEGDTDERDDNEYIDDNDLNERDENNMDENNTEREYIDNTEREYIDKAEREYINNTEYLEEVKDIHFNTKSITAKDSRTLRKNLNTHSLITNLSKEDIISDFSKISSSLFTSEPIKEVDGSFSTSFIKVDERKLFEDDESSDLLIDF
jgi:double-strand break repair protein MRE11